jgi:branched-chain amino acid transport system substrate-binding protein
MKYLFTLLFVFFITACDQQVKEEVVPIKVGSLMPYTLAPEWAKKYDEGLLLALNEVNKQGGVLGRPLEILRRDSQFDIGETVKILEEWSLREGIDIFTGTLAGNIALAVSEYAYKNKKLFLGTTICADELVWQKGNSMTFRLHAPCSSLGRMLAEEAIKSDIKRWTLIGFHSAYNHEVIRGFKDYFKESGKEIEFVEEQWTSLFKLEAGVAINSLRKSKAEGILNLLVTQDQKEFIRYGNSIGFFDEVELMLSPNFGLPEEYGTFNLEEIPSNLISGIYPRQKIQMPEHRKFLENYITEYNSAPYYTSLLAYMNVYALVEAIEKAGSDNSKKIAKAMRGMSFSSPIGDIKFRELDQQATLGFWVGKMKPGEDEVLFEDWKYKSLEKYLPSDEWIKQQRGES